MRNVLLAHCSALAMLAAIGIPPSRTAEKTWLDGEPYEVKDDPAAIEVLVKAVGDHSKVVGDRLDKVSGDLDEIKARQLDLEQRSVQNRGYDGPVAPQSWGAQVAKSDEIASINSNWKGRARIEVKATITSATTNAAGSAGALVVADHQAAPILMPRRKLRLRDLFAPGQTESNAIEWPKQKLRTNNAASVAEGALKPQSDLQFEMKQWPVRTIAHWMLASRQVLDDVPALESIIDSELIFGLEDVEDNQLLNGSGVGQDLSGVYTTATAFAPPFTMPAPVTMIDVLLLAIAQVDATNLETDGIVLNPLDWRKIQAIKDTTGRYIGGGPFSDLIARLWQMPVVTTTAMAQGKFMVGACRQGAQIFDRQEATVELSTEDSDNFRKNLVTLLGEERLAFVVKYEEAFVKGDFADAITAATSA